MATLICNAIPHRVEHSQVPRLTVDQLLQLEQCDRLELIALTHGWQLAATRIRQDCIAKFRSIGESVNPTSRPAEKQGAGPLQFSMLEIMRDLQALENDFVDVEFDAKKKTISVTTEPIELEGVFLGPFQVVLELRYLGQSLPYSVIAKEPNSAASYSSATHPHVQNDALCEGDGHHAIRRALADGRIYDFFQIVNQILHSYNSGSAYISLDDWDGVSCDACGDTVGEDDCCSCSQCTDRLCSNCSQSCDGCDGSFCNSCLSVCEGCQNSYCSGCLSPCNCCNQSFCEHCLTRSKCDDCINEENEAEEADDEDEKFTDAAANALCVGETDLHA